MARIAIAGLTGHVIGESGDDNRNVPVFLSIDTDSGQVTGHASFDEAAGVEAQEGTDTPKGGE